MEHHRNHFYTTAEVADILQVARVTVQAACRRYRERLVAAASADLAPRNHEIACIWYGSGRRMLYLIAPDDVRSTHPPPRGRPTKHKEARQ